MSQTIHDILKQYWGYDSFRDSQEEIINSVLDENDTLALLPTGGGKSICYQVPALVNKGICIVISPLIALMKDQVENLQKRGIKALAIFSGMNKREIDIALDNCVYGDYKFLYVSPERLQTEIFKVRLAKMKVNLIAVDESHCISQWGHDFRPAYQKIKEIRDIIQKSVPFLAVTATANTRVIQDIASQLSIDSQHIIKQSFARENLGYLVLKEENKKQRLIQIIRKTGGCGIVYVNTRRKTKEIAEFLRQNGITADYYHGGLSQEDRDNRQGNWIKNKTQVIVATNAFGMGIDKPDVRVVVHMEPPPSPEAYFQEAGRGGRDGKKSFAVLLYKPSDKTTLERFHELEFPDTVQIKKVYNALGNYFRLAIGGGENSNYEFDLIDFATKFNFEVITTHHCLSILGLAGYIHLSEAITRPNRVKFEVSNNELYNYQIKHPEHEGLIQLLLRKNEGIFDNLIGIDLTSIGDLLKKSAKEIEAILKKLKSYGILEFLPTSNQPLLTYTVDRMHEDRLKFPKAIYLDRKTVKKEQLDFMIRYCESDTICRSKLLLSYFDETEFVDCGTCDVCLARKKKVLSKEKFTVIEKEVEEIISQMPLGITQLVQKMPHHNQDNILEVVQWKLDENTLTYTDKNELVLTGK
jgi:ATP-dependent DNA helicase RecQ